MHKELVNIVVVAQKVSFIITISIDGIVKFWNKIAQGIEFIKTIKAYSHPVLAAILSPDHQRLLTSCPEERSIKLFDVQNFDLIEVIKVDFQPGFSL